jgi:hypothetical protein
MSELERALEQLGREVDWPATPAFTLRRARSRRWLIAVALAVVALAIAFAVAPARSAILRFFHLGAVSIERVDTLPAARERPLSSSLGVPIAQADARSLLGTPFRAPAHLQPRLYRSGQSVSALLAAPDPVLLTELRSGVNDQVLVKKLVGTSTDARGVDLGLGAPAVWIAGGEHVYLAPPLPARLAGNTLIWVRAGITYRLEGKALTLDRARALARELG